MSHPPAELPRDGEATTTETDPYFVLDFCEEAIIDAIATEDGLDGNAGWAVVNMIRAAKAARLSPPREGAGTTQRETELARRDAEECLTRMVEIAREALAGNEFYTDRPALWISTMEAHATVIRDALDYLAATPSSESRP